MSAEKELKELLRQNPELKSELNKFERKAVDLLDIENGETNV